MGVDIVDIVQSEQKKLEDFKTKTIAIDAYNSLYQFLAIIRQPDGTPLQDSKGRITSHLSGLFYRTANLLEVGIKPIYVFDGKPHPLKKGTIEGRISVKERAKEEWISALEAGDLEKAKSKAQQTSVLTAEMVREAQTLLEYLGIPVIQAKSEGEAQASYMARKGDVWAVGSQDFDALLFGSPILVRNLTITGRRKLPRKQFYVNIEPEMITLESALKSLEINREQLVDIGILVGTDFNEGIRGVGPKKALKLIKEFGSLDKVIKHKTLDIPNYEEIRKIFLNPEKTDDYCIIWKDANPKAIISFLCDEYEFSEIRVNTALKKIAFLKDISSQKSLDQWF